MANKTHMSTGDVAKLFDITNQCAINWCNKGKLEYTRIDDGPRMVLISSVLKFIEDRNIGNEYMNQDILEEIRETVK
jgi:hypothetical protein